MEIVKEGDKVQLVCELKLEDGTICYKNEQENPLVFIVGEGKFFPAIENELKDMKEGETKTVTLEPKDAFGIHDDGLVAEIPKKDLVTNANLNIGSMIKMKTASDKIIQGTVTETKDDTLTVDFNHPLAGRKVVFSVTVVSVKKNPKSKDINKKS
jgi:FKBP-type peptidyl-prolyl cis-trans isomerase 2